MRLKLTGGDRLRRLSELPIRSGVYEGFAVHASSPTSSREDSLALKHEVGSMTICQTMLSQPEQSHSKVPHSKREVLGLHMPNKELRRQRARVPAQAYILCPTFWAVLKSRSTISMMVALALFFALLPVHEPACFVAQHIMADGYRQAKLCFPSGFQL